MSSEKDDKENNIASFSFVEELPTYKVPTHCCGAVKITTMIIIITTAIIVEIAAFLGFCFYSKIQLEANLFSIIGCCLLFVWTAAVLLSIIGIFKEMYYLLIPVLVVEALFECFQLALSILWTIIGIEERVIFVHDKVLVYVALGFSFLIHLYYISLLISCIRHLKTKQDQYEAGIYRKPHNNEKAFSGTLRSMAAKDTINALLNRPEYVDVASQTVETEIIRPDSPPVDYETFERMRLNGGVPKAAVLATVASASSRPAQVHYCMLYDRENPL